MMDDLSVGASSQGIEGLVSDLMVDHGLYQHLSDFMSLRTLDGE